MFEIVKDFKNCLVGYSGVRTMSEWGPLKAHNLGNQCDGLHILQKYPKGPFFPAEFETMTSALEKLAKVRAEVKRLFSSLPDYNKIDEEWLEFSKSFPVQATVSEYFADVGIDKFKV